MNNPKKDSGKQNKKVAVSKVKQVKAEKKTNPWISHLSDYRKSHPGESFKESCTKAKATYKK